MTTATCQPIHACHVERRDRYGNPEAGRIRYGSIDLLWTMQPPARGEITVEIYPKATVAAMPEAERIEMATQLVTLAFAHSGGSRDL